MKHLKLKIGRLQRRLVDGRESSQRKAMEHSIFRQSLWDLEGGIRVYDSAAHFCCMSLRYRTYHMDSFCLNWYHGWMDADYMFLPQKSTEYCAMQSTGGALLSSQLSPRRLMLVGLVVSIWFFHFHMASNIKQTHSKLTGRQRLRLDSHSELNEVGFCAYTI